MIEKILITKEGSYQGESQRMDDLKKINFIYGSNGSGKTTISRVLASQSSPDDTQMAGPLPSVEDAVEVIGASCEVNWYQNKPLELLVYNRDFVAKHFRPDAEVMGIYTFGDNVDVSKKIEQKRRDTKNLMDDISKQERTLHGDSGHGGKEKEDADLETAFTEMCWKEKTKHKAFKEAFVGAGNKDTCKTRYETEAKNNTVELIDLNIIAEKATSVFSDDLTKVDIIPRLHCDEIIELEKTPILSKIVLGKDDVDIAAMITKLGNSDWVQTGIEFYNQNDDFCPFCQQQTTQYFRKNLNEYFDETYARDLKNIDTLQEKYSELSELLQGRLKSILEADLKFLNQENLTEKQKRLDGLLAANSKHIEDKRKEPSSNVTLEPILEVVEAIFDEIEAANSKAKENNETIENLADRKKELISQIWKQILEDTKTEANDIKAKKEDIQKAINGLNTSIAEKKGKAKEIDQEIKDLERKITSIKPTLEDINKLLFSFGFSNFSLAESKKSGFYKIVREDGSDAKETLSEGEKSFVTFLYFYQLIKGSFQTSGSTTQRIVVFDDPVSSLDSDVLFIVCNLIKGVVKEIREGSSSIVQIFTLTHNVYFHKEITFERQEQKQNNVPTFWTIQKKNGVSIIKRHRKNPVTSSYEMLWAEICKPDRPVTTAQNVMRRIIEHYFTFFGGINTDEIIDKFSGKDKMLCGSLFSWINDGSHSANDDLYIACDANMIEKYLIVFKKIFEETGALLRFVE